MAAKPAAFKPSSQDRTISLGGRNLVIRFSVRAVMALRDAWKVVDDPDEVEGALTADQKVYERLGKNTFDDFPTILWAATRTHHPELTLEDVISLLDEAGIEGLTELGDAMRASTPPEQKPHPRKAAAGQR